MGTNPLLLLFSSPAHTHTSKSWSLTLASYIQQPNPPSFLSNPNHALRHPPDRPLCPLPEPRVLNSGSCQRSCLKHDERDGDSWPWWKRRWSSTSDRYQQGRCHTRKCGSRSLVDSSSCLDAGRLSCAVADIEIVKRTWQRRRG